MMFCAYVALLTQSEDIQFSAPDKDVIEAAIKVKEGNAKKRIVFVYDTADKQDILKLLRPADRKIPCVGLLLERNETSVSLKGYKPSWAALSASAEEAKGWLQPKNRLFKETIVCSISLPSYCGRGAFATIYLDERIKLGGKHMGGGPTILKFSSLKGKWKFVGAVGRVTKA